MQVLESSEDGSISHPALLKDKVASPAGTTIAGLSELEASGVRGAMIRAVRASARRFTPDDKSCLTIHYFWPLQHIEGACCQHISFKQSEKLGTAQDQIIG